MSENVEFLDAPAKLVELSPIAKQLAELKSELKGVQFDVSTTAGDKAARAARQRCVGIRTGAKKVYEDWNAPMLAKQRGMRELVGQITEEVTALETPIAAQIKAEEDRKAAIKAEIQRVELEKQQAIQARINTIALYPTNAVGQTADRIAALRVALADLPISVELYEHRAGEAMQVQADAAAKLDELHATAVAAEAEALRLEEERIERERIRAEQEAEAHRQREAEATKLAAERAAFEAEQAAARAEREAEQYRINTAREAEAARQAQIRAEQDRRDAEAAAALKAQQDALDAQRREFEATQAAALKAEQDKAPAAEHAQREKEAADQKKAQEIASAESQAARLVPEHSGGSWSVGRAGSVVTDQPIPGLSGYTGHGDVQYYGGHLVAESIMRPADAQLIAAAPALLDALKQWQAAEHDDDTIELANARDSRDAAIAAATHVSPT